MKNFAIHCLMALVCSTVYAQSRLQLPRIFSDNMVLQRHTSVPVWGTTVPGATIRVVFDGQSYSAVADQDGQWKVSMKAHGAGGPFIMRIHSGSESVSISNILIGDVWLASGQSNMDREMGRHFRDSADLKQTVDSLRFFIVDRDASGKPLNDLRSGKWMVCSASSAPKFSAVGYYFSREIMRTAEVAVGVIESTWGGTPVQSWMSKAQATQFSYFDTYLQEIEAFPQEAMSMIKEDDALLVKRREVMASPFYALHQGVQFSSFDDSQWAAASLKDSAIMSKDPIWLRGSIAHNEQVTSAYSLVLPSVSGRVDAWINGLQVLKERYGWSRPTTIADSILKKGVNTVSIRIANAQTAALLRGLPKLQSTNSETIIESSNDWRVSTSLETSLALPKYYYTYPVILYNAMISPIVPFPLKGVIWYQGESNTDRAFLYRDLFPAMIEDWRSQWKQPSMPFLFVQLANFQARADKPGESDWAELREAQLLSRHVAHTGMAVTIDIGEAGDIHPRNKWDVGHRLALLAGRDVYKQKIVAEGPIYKDYRIKNDRIIIRFTDTGSGLKHSGEKLDGFTIAGADKKFYWADAVIDGDRVIVSSKDVRQPVAVRYGWANNPNTTLYNKEGLPASPFRTDSWKGITDEVTYPK